MPILSYKLDLISRSKGTVISEDHFGINLVATINTVRTNGPMDRIVEQLNAHSIRYPGGTVTETYFRPGEPLWRNLFSDADIGHVVAPDGSEIPSPRAFFKFAEDNNLNVTFVLPTLPLIVRDNGGVANIDQTGLEAVGLLVKQILTGKFGSVTIKNFEIGNEYYHYPNLTALEYGRVANALIKVVNNSINEVAKASPLIQNFERPGISVQAGAGWRGDDNRIIIESMEKVSLDAITDVSVHYYPVDLSEVGKYDRHLNTVSAWREAIPDRDIGLFASEWNVHGPKGSDKGLAQASTIVAAFSEMIEEGVTSADFWGVQSRWLDTSLSTLNANDNSTTDAGSILSRLTPAGEIFASLSRNTVGMKVIDSDRSSVVSYANLTRFDLKAFDGLNENVFGNEDQAIIYVSSRTDKNISISLDVDAYFGRNFIVSGRVLSSTDDPTTIMRDERSPLNGWSLPVFTKLTASQLLNGGSIILSPYSVVEIKVTLGDDLDWYSDGPSDYPYGSGLGVGILADYHDQPRIAHGLSDSGTTNRLTTYGTDHSDNIVGTGADDAIFGRGGGDTLFGAGGDDLLSGEFEDVQFDAASAMVYRLYGAVLGRAPEPAGLLSWTLMATDGMDATQLATRLTSSTEFQSSYGGLSEAGFVNLLYHNVLNRPADPGGLAAWTRLLDGGALRASVVAGFSESAELIGRTEAAVLLVSRAGYQADWADDVFRLYQAALGRLPDSQGFLAWTDRLAGGMKYLDVVTGFTQSTEFRGRYGAFIDDRDFVTLLYENVLGRAPDAAGLDFWGGRLNMGVSRVEVVHGVAQSPEFKYASASALTAWMRSGGPEGDRLDGGSGSNLLFGGIGADTFVFSRSSGGSHVVADLEAWDNVALNGFGYGSVTEAETHLVAAGDDTIFADQGVQIVFRDISPVDVTNILLEA